jgi:hypothetical protein
MKMASSVSFLWEKTVLRPWKGLFRIRHSFLPRPVSMPFPPLQGSEWSPSLQVACTGSVPHPKHFIPELEAVYSFEMLVPIYSHSYYHYLEPFMLPLPRRLQPDCILCNVMLCFCVLWLCSVMKLYSFYYRLWLFIRGTSIAVSSIWGAF